MEGMALMKVVRCACGAVILVVPDVKALGKAIDEHAAKHWNSEVVAEDLIEKVFVLASEA
jgi:hypothetical protein